MSLFRVFWVCGDGWGGGTRLKDVLFQKWLPFLREGVVCMTKLGHLCDSNEGLEEPRVTKEVAPPGPLSHQEGTLLAK